jgi:hypothetical protein
VTSCSPRSTLSAEGAGQSAAGAAVDAADNRAAATLADINIDKTAPTIAVRLSAGSNAAGWFNGPVTAAFDCADALSGVASCPASTVVSTDGRDQVVVGAATDRAGNAVTATVDGIQIDRTAPTVAYSGNAGTYTVDQAVNITCAAADGLSGIASATCRNITGPAASFKLGTNTFSATVVDKAGNAATGTVTFTVVATPGGVSSLTSQAIQSSPNYQALSPAARAVIDRLSVSVAQQLPAALATMTPKQKAQAIQSYQRAVQALVPLGWLTADQATTITRLVGGL